VPLTRKQIYRRRRIAVFGGMGGVLATAFYLPLTLFAPLGTVSATILPFEAPAQATAEVAFPEYGASGIGAIGFPGVLASAGSSEALPIASITKVVTALVVLDAKPLTAGEAGPDITFGDIDEQFYASSLAQDGIVKDVRSGQVMSQANVLSVMLLASANNYAQSLAHWAFGSEAAFVDAAAAWLTEHELSSTRITDPTGILPTNVSTVTDLVEIAKLAMSDPVIAGIVSLPRIDIPDLGSVANRNGLIGVDGIDGIKTGTLDESGACLLFSADYTVGSSTVTVVGVLLGGPNHETINAGVRGLLTGVVAGFHEVTLVEEGDQLASFETAWGDTADVVASSSQRAVSWSNTPVTVLMHVDELRTGDAGADVGEATFVVGERRVTVELELSAAIDDPGPWWRLGNPAELF
jgi:D-alanyl-D-alanine carboxypeptidase (penicillin-binding protein 5/6)